MIDRILSIFIKKYASKWLVLLFDIIIVIFTYFISFCIYYNFKLDFNLTTIVSQLPIVVMVSLISFLLVGSHKGVVRYTGIKDVINIIIGANILATSLFLITLFLRKIEITNILEFSGSIIYIHLLLNFLFLVGTKFLIKLTYQQLIKNDQIIKHVFIFGAGSAGMITYNAIINDVKTNIHVLGFIDDNSRKIGKKINLLSVYSLNQISPKLIKKLAADEVIISVQNIESNRLLEVSTYLLNLNLKVKIVPPIQNWINGDLSLGQIKDVNIEDLLGRTPINITNSTLTKEYENKTVLISGAAGSIGSEIVKNLIGYRNIKLILLDIAESPLYSLQQDLKLSGEGKFVAVIADIKDFKRLENIFQEYKPDIVFHAAAYKHVPLMEQNPYEAVHVNVCGTKNMANLSVANDVNKFVLISTDKAVNPTNVMGATKRIAELFVNCLKEKSNTKFVTTRFGNVLGSNGSVIPLFKKQIEKGGPLTVTHKEITRYFMTIREASQLVLEAATMGKGGEIFVFDMGESIKIMDLAKNMITLSGFHFPNEIDIEVIGLRPGEKIYEELLANGENTLKTYHNKIMIAKTKAFNIKKIESDISALCSMITKQSNVDIVCKMKKLVPEYISQNSTFEVLDDINNN